MTAIPFNNMMRTRILHASEAALAMLAGRGLPLTPTYYTVFFAYAMGHPPQVKQAIDDADASGAPLDEAALTAIHLQYLNDPKDQTQFLEETPQVVDSVVENLFGTLEQLRAENTQHVSALIGHVQQLHTHIDDDDLRSFAESAVETAMMLQADSDALAEALNESRQEIYQLRRDLATRIQESERDFLTGAYNRKAWDTRLAQEIQRAVLNPQASPFSLALIDIDYFKRINDTYGHAAGDEVIRSVARTIIHSVKGKDMVARYGGEEFALLLPETSAEGAVAVSEYIRSAISAHPIRHHETGEPYGTISVSIGVASLTAGEPISAVELLKKADEALYAAKRDGRNRVVIGS